MSTRMGTIDLGPFAPDRGPASVPARASVAAAAAAGVALVAGMLLDATSAADHPGMRSVASAMSLAGIALALAGLYQVSTSGKPGRVWVTLGLSLSAATGAAAFVYGAIREGTLRPARFADAFLDLELLGSIGSDLARGALNTVKLAFVSEILAIVVGLVIATFHLSDRRWLHLPAVGYVDVVRGLPLILLTAVVYGGLPQLGIQLDPFTAAVVSLTINASAYIAEIFRAGIQSLARGQMEAARSLGMTHGTAMITVIIPQAVRAVIPPLMSEFIALVKDTAIVLAIIGITVSSADLFGTARTAAASTFSPTPYVGAAIGYLIITIPLTRVVTRLERRLRAGL